MSYQPKTNWQLDDIVMPDDMNRIENGIVNLENNVDTKATKTMYTATIPTTGWTATGSHYYINITVTGILNTDSPIISPKFTGLTQAQEEACLESWNKISCIYTNANSIQVQVFEEIPTTEIPIQIMCIR